MRRSISVFVVPLCLLVFQTNVRAQRVTARAEQQAPDMKTSLRIAAQHRAAKRFEDARLLLEKVVAGPHDARAAVLLGATYEDLGRYGDARRMYRTYIDRTKEGAVRDELVKRMSLLQRKELRAQVRSAIARESELANTPPQPWTVAVFPFEFIGTDAQYAPLGRALAELLVADLSQTTRLKVLERAQVQVLLDEMQLSQKGAIDQSTAARTGRLLGAERVVHGSIDGAEQLQLETTVVRVTDALWPGEEGQADRPVSLTESDRVSALIEMQKRLALRIYASLGIELTPEERARVTRRATENVMAILSYGRGLQAEDAGDYAAAARHFSEAARLDPQFSAARQSSERASTQAQAETVSTDQLVSSVEASTAPRPSSQDFFLPNPIARDKAAEILRTEGSTATILEIIIRRP